MSRRTLLDDPSGDAVVLVVVEADSDRFVVGADRASGPSTSVVLAVSEGRLTVTHATAVEAPMDVTHDPVGALRALFWGDPHPGLLDHVIDEASRFSARSIRHLNDGAAEQLLLSGHPALAGLVGEGVSRIPTALPGDVSAVLRCPTVREAVDAAAPTGRSSRQLRDAVVSSWTRGGVLRVRDVSMLRAGGSLGDAHLVSALEHETPVEPWAAVTRRVAEDCGRVLARLGRTNHAAVLRQLVADRSGLAHMRLIAAADRSGVDTTGIRGGDRLDWLLKRCAEALERPVPGVPIGHLNGRRIGDSGRRVRVVTTKTEFSHVASRMSNCLATYGPAAMKQGSSFAVIVGADGEPEQALEVRAGRVVQWAGPSNRTVSPDERRAVLEALNVQRPTSLVTRGFVGRDEWRPATRCGRDARIDSDQIPKSA